MSERGALLSTVARTGLVLVVALVLWGGLLLVSALVNAWGEGPSAAFARLIPLPGSSVWGWLGPFSVLLALAAALGLAGLLVLSSRRTRTGG